MPTPERELMDARRDKPNLDRGAELYGTCAACHGPTGSGTVDGQVPRIAGQHASVLVKQRGRSNEMIGAAQLMRQDGRIDP
jgi:cytochrome c553